LGLPSIAAALAGGRVLATDWSADAVRAAADNAQRNEVELESAVVGWDSPGPIVARAPWRFVIASDVLYERRNVALLLELLPQLVDAGGEVLIADPQRPPAERFLEDAAADWHVRTTGSSRSARTRIHRLRRRV
jgi:predicted nicotinamide N-methyase